MFWTESLIQKTLFGEDEYRSSSTVSELIRFAEEAFPDCECNFHRHVAFLTHEASQKFLRPMLTSQFGGLDNAKVPTIKWLEDLGSLETFARCTRAKEGNGKPARLPLKTTPAWYLKYHKTGRYANTKKQAEDFWMNYMGVIHCSLDARHEYQVMHHSDYGRLGEGDEFRYLVPLCNSCHASCRARGPKIPAAVPESVRQWL